MPLKKFQIIQLSLDGLALCPKFGVCFVCGTISSSTKYTLTSLCRVWARKIRFTQLAPCLTSSYFIETNLSCIVSAETKHIKFLPNYTRHTTGLFLEPSPKVLAVPRHVAIIPWSTHTHTHKCTWALPSNYVCLLTIADSSWLPCVEAGWRGCIYMSTDYKVSAEAYCVSFHSKFCYVLSCLFGSNYVFFIFKHAIKQIILT